MAYEEVADLNPDTVIALGGKNKKTNKNNATEIEGYYLGSRKVDSKKSKSGFAYIHVFQTPKGNIGVWGKTDMDRKVLGVPPGTMTLVVFDKMVPTPNGDMYKFRVAVDKGNTITVTALPAGEANTSDTTGSDDTDDSTEESNEDDQDAAQAAALQAAERKARVEALLNKPKR